MLINSGDIALRYVSASVKSKDQKTDIREGWQFGTHLISEAGKTFELTNTKPELIEDPPEEPSFEAWQKIRYVLAETEVRLKQSDYLYDYIKFHIGLYVATPAALALTGDALGVSTEKPFKIGLYAMIVASLFAGYFACTFIANHLFEPWKDLGRWEELGKLADNGNRKFKHHYLYWVGLAFGLIGLIVS